MENDRVQQLQEGLVTRLGGPNGQGEMLARTVNVHLSKAQPGWDFQ